MPKTSSIDLELTNIEFYHNPSPALKHNYNVIKSGKAFPLEDLSENTINILFQKFMDDKFTKDVLQFHFLKTQNKLAAVQSVIRKYFAEICSNKMDIDENGNLNFEKVSAEKRKSNLVRNSMPFGDVSENSLWEISGENFILVHISQERSLNIKQWKHLFKTA